MIALLKYDLNTRERLLLKATIEDYIETKVPISSGYLKNKHNFGLSPATIRSVLASLENKGLLSHPHTSSGRIPTDAGYRYFVDQLLDGAESNRDEYHQIEQSLKRVSYNVDELMQAVASTLASASRMFGLVMVEHYQESLLKDIELVRLSSERVMLVLAMKSGFINSITLNLRVAVEQDVLESVTRVLKERLIDLTLTEIQLTIKDRLRDTDIYKHEVIQILVNNPVQHFYIASDNIIYQSTLVPLLEQPEFQNASILQKTITALEPSIISKYLITQLGDMGNFILIGSENPNVNLEHCSLISSRFKSADINGQLIVVGPTRIPYQNILNMLANFTEILPDVC